MAGRVGGDLVGVHVAVDDGLARDDPESLSAQRRLVEQLGGKVHDIVGHDPAESLAAFAKREKATQLVLGATRSTRWHELIHGSFVARVDAARGRCRRPRDRPARHGSRGSACSTTCSPRAGSSSRHRRLATGRGGSAVADRPHGSAAREHRPLHGALDCVVDGVGHRRHRWEGRCRVRGDLRLAARQLVLRRAVPHTHDRRRREHRRPLRVRRRRVHRRDAGRRGLEAFVGSSSRPAGGRSLGAVDIESRCRPRTGAAAARPAESDVRSRRHPDRSRRVRGRRVRSGRHHCILRRHQRRAQRVDTAGVVDHPGRQGNAVDAASLRSPAVDRRPPLAASAGGSTGSRRRQSAADGRSRRSSGARRRRRGTHRRCCVPSRTTCALHCRRSRR